MFSLKASLSRPGFPRHWYPLLIAWLALLVAVGERLLRVLSAGPLLYALDDPYIHMAMAKHVVADGVWGVGRDAFAFCSSSPLWTFLLTIATALFGPWPGLPLLLNLVCAGAAVWVLDRWLRAAGLRAAGRVAALLAFVFCSPLPAVIFCGLEHSLQILLVLTFLWALPSYLRQEPPAMGPWRLCLLAALLATCRYEDLFVVLMACLLLFFAARKRRLAVAVGLSAAVPLVGYGLWAVAHGWYPVPTSILLKAALPTWTGLSGILFSLGGRALGLLGQRTQVAGLLGLALALRLVEAAPANGSGDRKPGWFRPTIWVFAGTVFLHYQFAGAGWFYRYEAYLAAMGIAALALYAAERRRPPAAEAAPGLLGRMTRGWPALALLVIAVYPLAAQGLRSYAEIELATRNIRDQHLQSARFIQRYYPDAAVALNDIGLTSFLTDARVLDLAGLADFDVARARLKGALDRDAVQLLAVNRGVRMAILYRNWFKQGLPRDWAEVARLTIRDCVVGEPTVTLFAVVPDERAPLLQHLLEFVPSLPAGVRVELARD